MKAVVVTPRVKNSARIIEVDKPTPKSDEVLVKVLQVGIDGTDYEIYSGLYGDAPDGEDYLILGHESLGRVESVGKEIKDIRKGDLVVATVRRPCFEDCLNCHNKESDMCLTGNYRERGIKGLHGFLTEYYVENPEYLVKVPREFSKIGVLLEPLSIVEKGIYQALKIQERMHWNLKNALVLGAGSIGILATIILRNMDINTYTVATRPKGSFKSNLVEEIGAHYINVNEDPLETLPRKIGNIDFIIEATGNSTVAFKAMSILGTNGILCLVGVYEGDKKLLIDIDRFSLKMVLGNKVIFGSVNANLKYFKIGVAHFREFETKWPGLMEKIITRRVPFMDFAKGLKREKEDIKTVIEISEA